MGLDEAYIQCQGLSSKLQLPPIRFKIVPHQDSSIMRTNRHQRL